MEIKVFFRDYKQDKKHIWEHIITYKKFFPEIV